MINQQPHDHEDDHYKKLFREQKVTATQQEETNYFTSTQEFIQFRKHVPKKIAVTLKPNQKTWSYYQFGDKSLQPLIILPDLCATAESMFQQVLSLAPRGYHLIVVDYAPCYTHDEFVIAFRELVDYHLVLTDLPFHLLGAGLGGLLAQCYAEKCADRIGSLILCNSFSDNDVFAQRSLLCDFYQLIPNFLLKMKIENMFTEDDIQGEVDIVKSNEYMVETMQSLPQRQIASRLSLLCQPKIIDRWVMLPDLSDDKITIIQTLDRTIYPTECKSDLEKTYPNAKFAYMKTGGTFPYLSKPEEFNIYVTVHMRNIAGQNKPVYENPSEEEESSIEREQEEDFSILVIEESTIGDENDLLVHEEEIIQQQRPRKSSQVGRTVPEISEEESEASSPIF